MDEMETTAKQVNMADRLKHFRGQKRFGKVRRVLPLITLLVVAVGQTPLRPILAADPFPAEAFFDSLVETTGTDEPVTISARVEATANRKTLVITATLAPGWHLYSLEQPPGGPKRTSIEIDSASPMQPAGPFTATPPPTKKKVTDVPGWEGLTIEEHSGEVIWSAPLRSQAAASGDILSGTVSLQLCEDNSCTPPQTIPFRAKIDGPAPEVTAEQTSTPPPRVQHLPERGHLVVEAAVGDVTESPNACTVWPLTIELLPEAGWHLYAARSNANTDVGQGKPTIVSLVPQAGIRVCEIFSDAPQFATDPELRDAGAVEGPVRLKVMVEVPEAVQSDDAAATAESGQLDLLIGYQTCSDSTCDPPWASRLTFHVPAGDSTALPRLTFTDSRYGEAAQKPATLAPWPPTTTSPPPSTMAATDSGRGNPANGAKPLSLPLALAAGLLGGLILNLMPCVLPVLGLKLMSFAQQTGRARRDIFQLNLWYCAGLYAVFFVLATASVAANIGLAGSNLAWGEQFTSAGFNITMTGIVFAFALSFLGIWEIPIPGFIGSTAGKVQTQEGPAGSFLKGVLSTVLATPCSGPFLGPVFGFTLTQPTPVTYAVFASIATGMSLPYLLVGVFPGLVRFIPKPGVWMETLKELLGFVMLGTVVFLFTFLNGDYFVPTFALLIGIWAGCWWVGRIQKQTGTAGFGRWLQAGIVTAAIGVASFAFLGPVESVIEWQPFTRARLTELQRKGATVMVDFSADWCLTCKYNLNFAIETPRVKRALSDSKIVPMLADWTDGSPEIKAMLESLDSKSIPVLAFFPGSEPGKAAAAPIVLRDLVTEAQVLEAIKKAGGSPGLIPEMRARSAMSNTATRL
jgi:suppressor for copper-sensitivity B